MALLEAHGTKAPLFTQAERTISRLPDRDLKRTLSVFLESAGGDLDAFRMHLEQWFDDAMDRVIGIYKRTSQYVMLFLGLAMAVALNVDSIRAAVTLWEKPSLGSALVANAKVIAERQHPPSASDNSFIGDVLKPYRELFATETPVGWTEAVPWSLTTLGGWLITAAAVALGAPIWFGLLQKFVDIRNSGPKPSRRPTTTISVAQAECWRPGCALRRHDAERDVMPVNTQPLSDQEIKLWFDTPGEVPPNTFEAALVLGGTVSAGAYTAGALEFLIEALDAWTGMRDGAAGQTVPRHKVVIRIITGTSGGGVNAAIAARALAYDFPHVSRGTETAIAAGNPFYDIWINRLTLASMLRTDDLAEGLVTAVIQQTRYDTRDILLAAYPGVYSLS
jgi:hypothetical protein